MARGDHLYYFRAGGIYSHHGIDVGDGSVIHYESSPWMKFVGQLAADRPPQVVQTTLASFSQGNEVQVRFYSPEDRPGDDEEVMRRAFSRLGEAGYGIFGNNCEHFAVWCKTGLAASTQVEAHQRAVKAVVQGAPLGMMLLRTARKLPVPYRGVAIVSAAAAAGVVYAGHYLKHRLRHRDEGIS